MPRKKKRKGNFNVNRNKKKRKLNNNQVLLDDIKERTLKIFKKLKDNLDKKGIDLLSILPWNHNDGMSLFYNILLFNVSVSLCKLVGISQFVMTKELKYVPISGKLKERYEDFIVNEVDMKENILEINNMDPINSDVNVEGKVDMNDIRNELKECLDDETVDALIKFYNDNCNDEALQKYKDKKVQKPEYITKVKSLLLYLVLYWYVVI